MERIKFLTRWNVIVTVRIADKINLSIVKTIQEVGADAYGETRRTVPVKTGRLKRSGWYQYTSNGYAFGYTAYYAAIVEYGRKKGYTTVPARWVAPHRREVPHYSTMKSNWAAGKGAYPRKRWIKVQGYWVKPQYRWVAERKPRYFITRALDRAMLHFASTLERRLNMYLG